MSLFTGEKLVEFISDKIGTPYVFGAKPWWGPLTCRHVDYLGKLYPATFSREYLDLISHFIGSVCTDCSGLICWYTGISISSAQMYEQAEEIHELNLVDTFAIKMGSLVWKPGHVGVYIGNGECIEARGVNYGTLETKLEDRDFTHWLLLPDFNYNV